MSPQGTLDKILEKLPPKTIAMLLFTAILVVAGVSSIAIYTGNGLVIWGSQIIGPRDMSAQSFIKSLPSEVGGTIDEAREKITVKVNISNQESYASTTLQAQITSLNEKLTTKFKDLALAQEEISRLQKEAGKNKDKFLSKITRLKDEIDRWDGFINTKFRVDEKKEVFALVQQILQRIGHYD